MSERAVHRGVAALLVLALALTAALVAVVGAARPAAAADLSRFDPGHIISDAIFYDAGTMTAEQIQSFLVAKGVRCSSTSYTTCLKDYRQTTAAKPADARCTSPYAAATGETAAQIVAKVAQACRINPQVLLVTLQKEQGFVTATSGKTAATYAKAMGFACPDTAPCDTQYAGFFNQVYRAAWQLRGYALNPTWYGHRAGRVNLVRYHPNAACGSSAVLIANQATASLYNYTPYQPNAAALTAGYGSGDGCSAYGNRNFWSYFTDWFGSTVQRAPRGALDAASASPGEITVRGWAFDPDVAEAVEVRVTVDGAPAGTLVADRPRPDVGRVFGVGADHGFSGSVGAADGTHRVCVVAVDGNRGPEDPQVGCATVTVRNTAPRGAVDSVTASGGRVTVAGWALDPDTDASIRVQVLVDGRAAEPVLAAGGRRDVAAAFGRGAAHGFGTTVPAPDGRRTVCVQALDSTSGAATVVGCREVTVRNAAPIGTLDALTSGPGTLTVRGWALDPDTTAPIRVHVYVDGAPAASVGADGRRPDVAAAYRTGDRHGFRATVPATDGSHEVCLYAIDASRGASPRFACRTVQVHNAAPAGDFTADASREAIGVQGWVTDPDDDRPLDVVVRVDGVVAGRLTTGDARTATGARTFGWQRPAGGPADHRICVEAADASTRTPSPLGCRTVTVNGLPFGALDEVTPGTGTVRVSGWAIDPNTTEPIRVHVHVDGVPTASLAAAGSRPDVEAAFGLGAAHGFGSTVTVPAGERRVCVFGIDPQGETNPQLGCRTVVVRGQYS